ncbi:Rrf2 family transcriptional regulator [Bradyrhizobium sp. LTSPM299]|uniref:RrF2 family transcriptional regulator n=1 Tax=Bradyrhizobium sp. LTSPM299 TaxID=1619233 RepID=UPI0005C9EF81|nr:Rrf2 family transcriptional regulator [Bradyrhizobium sp. LTSPM299]
MIDLRFSTALQMVLSVALADQDGFRCTSRTLAEGLGTNPSFIRKLLIPLTREGMLVAAIGKGGGLHLGRAAEQITLRDLYLAVMEDKKLLVGREDVAPRCRISANINGFFAEVATDAETAMLDALGRRNIADSLAELLRRDAIRMKRVTKTANAAE